jgi:alkanesulfonate monooxygenase SsuD/methylene tetrahydromethanopterin reductase-like flavin-dependent oxidoreductase (luciferase family)
MRCYTMTEEPYPDAWTTGASSLRVNLPNRLCDPDVAANLYHEYIDEWQLSDEMGMDIFVNEHHSTATCLTASANIILAILARTTKKARLLALGFPIGNRPDPLRVAEELSMIDVISRGRLEMGFVRGVPYEIHPSNSNPATQSSRFWEAHDFILKAMTSHDGPFSWEGEHFQYRNVNIWPRPYQQPHPPVWISCLSMGSAREIGLRGHVLGTVMSGYNAKNLFNEYRKAWRERGRSELVPLHRLCYAAFLGIGTTEAEGHKRGNMVAQYLRTNAIVDEPFKNPPGYVNAAVGAKMVKKTGSMGFQSHNVFDKQGRDLGGFTGASVDALIQGGLLFSGTPDQVYDQIVDFYEAVDGFDHLQLMTQAGNMPFKETEANITLFAREVMPRLKDYAKKRRKEMGLPAEPFAA